MAKRLCSPVFLLSLAMLGFLAPIASLQSATLLFEGRYAGTPYGTLRDNVYSMRFSIYDALEGGTKLWPQGDGFEIHPSVPVTEGHFSVLLGSRGAPLTSEVRTDRVVYVQIGVCLPAGAGCSSFEPLPVRLPISTQGPAGIANDHAHWGQTWTGSGSGLTLNSEGGVGLGGTSTRGTGVQGVGDKAYDTSLGGHFSGWSGVLGEAFGANSAGVKGVSGVNTGIGVWGESQGQMGYAGYFAAPRGTGIYIGEAGMDGLSILRARNTGIKIHDAGSAASQIYPPNLELGTTRDAVSIGGAKDYGIWVGFAGRSGVGVGRSGGTGLWVGEASGDGIRVEWAKKSGLSIGRTEEDGIHIAHAVTSGLVIDNAEQFGVHVKSGGPAVHGEGARGAGGEFTSGESHALVADGPTLMGGRTPEQIGMLKWCEARETHDVIETKPKPSGLAFDGAHIWVTHAESRDTLQIRASDGYEVENLSGATGGLPVIHDGQRLWFVSNYPNSMAITGFDTGLWKKEGVDASIMASVTTAGRGEANAIAFDGRRIWVGADDGIYRFTPSDKPFSHLPPYRDGLGLTLKGFHLTPWGRIGRRLFELHTYTLTGSGLAYDGKHIWIANSGTNRVIKMHADNMQNLGAFDVGREPVALAFDGANMWSANYGDGTVSKVRTSDGKVLGTYPVGTKPRALVFDGFHIWAANEGDNTLTKLRASDGGAVGTFKTGNSPRALVFDGRHVWVANYLSDTLMKF